jgi:cation transport ATPase
MDRRLLLLGLVVAATAAFVIGVRVEQSSDDDHGGEPAAGVESSESNENEQHAHERSEAETAEDREEEHRESLAGKADEDERVLGVDLEATPFVLLAAAVLLGLALAVGQRPDWTLLLGLAAAAMVAFAALDVREITHQLDEDNGGLALLAGVVAVLHLAAGAVALLMGRAPGVAARERPT